MRRAFIVLFIASIAVAGCESKQHKLDRLRAEFSTANQQYFNDCIAPNQNGTDAYFKGEKPKPVSPQQEAAHNRKCDQESARVGDLQKQVFSLSK
ncbi:MAG: hypothetical protein ACLGXA_05510 [Acidobacteriota bacterium]